MSSFISYETILSLNCIPKGSIDYKSALAQSVAWRQTSHHWKQSWTTSPTHVCNQGPSSPTQIDFHPSMINNYIHHGMKLLIHSQTSKVQPLKFGSGWVFSSHTLQGVWLFIHIYHQALTHCGRVTQYDDGSMLCKNPIFFTMKEFPQI